MVSHGALHHALLVSEIPGHRHARHGRMDAQRGNVERHSGRRTGPAGRPLQDLHRAFPFHISHESHRGNSLLIIIIIIMPPDGKRFRRHCSCRAEFRPHPDTFLGYRYVGRRAFPRENRLEVSLFPLAPFLSSYPHKLIIKSVIDTRSWHSNGRASTV